MKLVSYRSGANARTGLLIERGVLDLVELDQRLPPSMQALLNGWEDFFPLLKALNDKLKNTHKHLSFVANAELLSPVPEPVSLRDGYAFRQHVASARKNRNVPMIPEFDEYPIFYFGNHRTVSGPGIVRFMPDHFEELDFELEAAIVIGKKGINIRAAEADAHIAGLMVMNDWSARRLQREEMILNLGPAKGKDFATSLGPWLVTIDELEPYRCAAPDGHEGASWDLPMNAVVNGVEVSSGNLKDMSWTFAELIERASYGVELVPGEVIGSGTVGTGCFLELNGRPGANKQWLQQGDKITLSIQHLGDLTHWIEKQASNHSILSLRKKPLHGT